MLLDVQHVIKYIFLVLRAIHTKNNYTLEKKPASIFVVQSI